MLTHKLELFGCRGDPRGMQPFYGDEPWGDFRIDSWLTAPFGMRPPMNAASVGKHLDLVLDIRGAHVDFFSGVDGRVQAATMAYAAQLPKDASIWHPLFRDEGPARLKAKVVLDGRDRTIFLVQLPGEQGGMVLGPERGAAFIEPLLAEHRSFQTAEFRVWLKPSVYHVEGKRGLSFTARRVNIRLLAESAGELEYLGDDDDNSASAFA